MRGRKGDRGREGKSSRSLRQASRHADAEKLPRSSEAPARTTTCACYKVTRAIATGFAIVRLSLEARVGVDRDRCSQPFQLFSRARSAGAASAGCSACASDRPARHPGNRFLVVTTPTGRPRARSIRTTSFARSAGRKRPPAACSFRRDRASNSRQFRRHPASSRLSQPCRTIPRRTLSGHARLPYPSAPDGVAPSGSAGFPQNIVHPAECSRAILARFRSISTGSVGSREAVLPPREKSLCAHISSSLPH